MIREEVLPLLGREDWNLNLVGGLVVGVVEAADSDRALTKAFKVPVLTDLASAVCGVDTAAVVHHHTITKACTPNRLIMNHILLFTELHQISLSHLQIRFIRMGNYIQHCRFINIRKHVRVN